MRIIPIITILFFIYSHSAYAEVIINEIYPAPEQNNLEWVEIYNDSDSLVDISAYMLVDSSGKKLILNGIFIDPKGFTIATSSSILNNAGDTIFLKDINGFIIDKVEYDVSLDSSKSLIRCVNPELHWKETKLISKNTSNDSACTEFITSENSNQTEITPTLILEPSYIYQSIQKETHNDPSPYPQQKAASFNISQRQPVSFTQKHAPEQTSQEINPTQKQKNISIIKKNTYTEITLSLFAWSCLISIIAVIYSIKEYIQRYKNEKEHVSLQNNPVASSNDMDDHNLSSFLKTTHFDE